MVALARTEFDLGIEAARRERWSDALAHFRRVHELTDSPQVLLNIASALVQTGRFVEGAETYRRFLSEAPDSIGELRSAALQALEQIIARTPRVTFEVAGLLTADEVLLDGTPLRRAALGAPVPVDPGRHTLTVVRARFERGRREFQIAERATSTVSLSLATLPGPHGVLHSPVFWAVAGVALAGMAYGIGVGIYVASEFNGNVPPGRVLLR